MKDNRISYRNECVQHEGQAWFIDAKLNLDDCSLKVYRVHGDVTDPKLLNEAIAIWGQNEVDRELNFKVKRKRGPR